MIVGFLYNTVLVVIRFVKEHTGSPKVFNRWYERNHVSTMISWALSSTANSVALAVTLGFWIALYDYDNPPSTPMDKLNNFDVHLIQVRF